MKIYFSIIFAVFFLYRRLCVHLLLMKCEKRNGDEISSTLEFFSGCAPSGQIAVEDKGGGVIVIWNRSKEISAQQKWKAIRFPFVTSFYIPDRTFLARMERKTFRNWTLRANVTRLVVQGWGEKKDSYRNESSFRIVKL